MTLSINKHTRSYIFLVITVIVIFAINALLPTIAGQTHYTADEVSMTYGEYVSLKEDNPHYTLTWGSEEDVREYIESYKALYPEQSLEVITPPDEFVVEVYTKFFFQHSFWYITTITRVVSAVLLFYAVFNVVISKLKDTHTRYLELNAEMEQLSNNALDPNTFEPWMQDDFNYNRKVNQHVDNIRYALSTLEQRTPYRIRALAKKDPNNPKCTKYLEQRSDLLSKLDEEYIKDIVVHSPVKHFKYIQPTFVTCGVNRIGRTTDTYSLIESDIVHIGKGAVQKVATTVGITVMFATLLTITVVTAADKPWYWVVIDILTTIAPLVMQIPMAFDYSNSYMEEHLLTNLLSRRSIALLYLAYIQKGKEHEKDITRD